jgi:hypothetical protein
VTAATVNASPSSIKKPYMSSKYAALPDESKCNAYCSGNSKITKIRIGESGIFHCYSVIVDKIEGYCIKN